MHCCRIEQTRNQRFQFQSSLLKSPEVADDGMLFLLLRILEHNFGVTQDSSDWGLEFLAHIREESPMEAVGFGAQRFGFGYCRTLSPPASKNGVSPKSYRLLVSIANRPIADDHTDLM